MDATTAEVVLELGKNRRLAHDVLFRHRHPLKTPAFHYEMIDAFHSPESQVVQEAFRGAGKSTIAEDALVVGALCRDFRNAIIIGSSFERAKERLTAIKNEFTVNENIDRLFGSMEGPVWGEGRIVLKNGVCFTALGSGMSLRGTKYLDARPDFCLIDDLEDEESVRTPEARDKLANWLYRACLPALQPAYRVRFLGNQLDGDAVIVRVAKDAGWRHLRFPVMRQVPGGVQAGDLPAGEWAALWPEQYSLAWIAAKRAEYARQGLLHAFNCEYMCEAEDVARRTFSRDMVVDTARTRVWEAVYAAYDPARTVGQKSAATGKVIASWIGNRLVVWEGDAPFWLPDEIVADIIEVDDRWSPVAIGVEATGLEEFILQPLRHRALARGAPLPIRRLVPPRGKDEFIRSLQPYFKAREIEFVNVSPEARGQLLSFPTGRKDFPNALAYLLMMRPGQPVYGEFSASHVVDRLVRYRESWWLAVAATTQYTCAVLLQTSRGGLRIHADWVREGPPGDALADIVGAASLEAGDKVRLICPQSVPNDLVGLRVAAGRIPIDMRSGGDVVRGREALRKLLQRTMREEPMVQIRTTARWTLNGFAAGYSYELDKRGVLTDKPAPGPYRVLFDALESFVAGMQASTEDGTDNRRYATTPDGRRYLTIRANA